MADWFAPGFRAGGPIRSVVNFTEQLKDAFDIRIVTGDRDLGETAPYPGIEADSWITRDGYQVFYASAKTLTWSRLKSLIQSVKADVLYLNSMFSVKFALFPMLMFRLGHISCMVFVSPRGMLKPSALKHKRLKKTLFLRTFRLSGAYRDVNFLSTDKQEADDIARAVGPDIICFTTGNLPGVLPPYILPGRKLPGQLNILFVGRIHPIKNLDYLLHALSGLRGKVRLSVVATLEDRVYWDRCREIIERLDADKSVVLMQDLPHEEITGAIQANHLFVLPTLGENFGHAIYESLAAGRPVLISDQTPWRNLQEKRAGWDMPLNDPDSFRKILQKAVDMSQETLEAWCLGARQLAVDYQQGNQVKKMYIQLFTTSS